MFVVASLAYHLLLERLVPGWPLVNVASVVRIGGIAVPYSSVSRGVLLVVFGVGLAVSFVAARRNQGLLVSLLVASAAVGGFFVGGTIYYTIPLVGFQFGSPVDVIESIGLGVLIGVPTGIPGFLVGRAWALVSKRTFR